jgi:hypothetical protein
MEQLNNNAHTRLRERAFTIWEEAGGDVHEGYSLWHKLRPMLPHRDFPTAKSMAGDERRHATAKDGDKAS